MLRHNCYDENVTVCLGFYLLNFITVVEPKRNHLGLQSVDLIKTL
jgi:hypothetical protein